MAISLVRITCAVLLLLAGAARGASVLPDGSILVVGDSLSAGYGLPADRAWPAQLAGRLTERGLPWTVVNAAISGDTSAGGRARLSALLERHRPALVLIELGANDALRGQPLSATAGNLRAMIDAARATGARVGLIGMQIPPTSVRSTRASSTPCTGAWRMRPMCRCWSSCSSRSPTIRRRSWTTGFTPMPRPRGRSPIMSRAG
ncbi:arylesterase [Immundisolibacter sp.]|uniref:arylesterase n=1 Tax=Immundisolibacter sp. TaxID=1934948 RepID=UPI003561ABAA